MNLSIGPPIVMTACRHSLSRGSCFVNSDMSGVLISQSWIWSASLTTSRKHGVGASTVCSLVTFSSSAYSCGLRIFADISEISPRADTLSFKGLLSVRFVGTLKSASAALCLIRARCKTLLWNSDKRSPHSSSFQEVSDIVVSYLKAS